MITLTGLSAAIKASAGEGVLNVQFSCNSGMLFQSVTLARSCGCLLSEVTQAGNWTAMKREHQERLSSGASGLFKT